MNHEYEPHREGSPAAATTHNDPAEPGQASRSAQLRKPAHPVASGLVQRRANAADEAEPSVVHAAAARGVATTSSQLPHLDTIQRSFGHHDVSSVQAHMGPEAAASARAMGALAFATGNHVVLGSGTDLHTAAHEAAHVVQQRGGVQLKEGVGEVGDPYERHAEAVADLVVQGRSAERVLDAYAMENGAMEQMLGRSAPPVPVQRTMFIGTERYTHASQKGFEAGDNIRHVVRNATLKRALEVQFNSLSEQNRKNYFQELANVLGTPLNPGQSLDSIVQEIYKLVYLNPDNLFAGNGATNQVIGFAADRVQKYGEILLEGSKVGKAKST